MINIENIVKLKYASVFLQRFFFGNDNIQYTCTSILLNNLCVFTTVTIILDKEPARKISNG